MNITNTIRRFKYCMCVHRLLGKLVINLQHVVSVGQLLLRESLTDSQHSLTDVSYEHSSLI